MGRKFERLLSAMRLEQEVDQRDRLFDSGPLEDTCEESGPVVKPFEEVVDPKTGRVTYRRPSEDKPYNS